MNDKTHHEHHGRRVEDVRLITGAGRYASDWSAPRQLYGHFVRSDRAHAEIVSVNTKNAAASPGVKRVFTGEDAVQAG
jgi:carbon-monoxide dehydrogenase large subunit